MISTEILCPSDIDGLRTVLATHQGVTLVGAGSQSAWLPPSESPRLSLAAFTGVVAHSPADLVCSVRAGTTLADLQAHLAAEGQFLPVIPFPGAEASTLGGLVAMALPHQLESQFGPLRDLVIGMTVLLADGSVAKSGALVVKSVAGFDAHKLFAGSRGGLGVILEVNLRVFSGNLPELSPLPTGATHLWRVLATDFDLAQREPGVVFSDKTTHTLGLDRQPPQWSDSWWVGPGGSRWPSGHGPLERQAKAVLDPEGRFAEGFAR